MRDVRAAWVCGTILCLAAMVLFDRCLQTPDACHAKVEKVDDFNKHVTCSGNAEAAIETRGTNTYAVCSCPESPVPRACVHCHPLPEVQVDAK